MKKFLRKILLTYVTPMAGYDYKREISNLVKNSQ